MSSQMFFIRKLPGMLVIDIDLQRERLWMVFRTVSYRTRSCIILQIIGFQNETKLTSNQS